MVLLHFKSKDRNRLDVEANFRIKLTNIEPDIDNCTHLIKKELFTKNIPAKDWDSSSRIGIAAPTKRALCTTVPGGVKTTQDGGPQKNCSIGGSRTT